jgi:hypothetical protein
MRSAQYTSFSVFGLFFTFVTGILIIAASFLLEPILRWLYRRGLYSRYNHLEWTTNSALQLQRLGYEGVPENKTTWYRCTRPVPVTESGVAMSPLNLSDPEHPTLSRVMSVREHGSEKGSF